MRTMLMMLAGLAVASPVYGEQAIPVPTEETAKPAPAAAAKPAPASNAEVGTVARAVFTSEIQDREPTDKLTELKNNVENIYFFTELKGMEGQTITHRWEHNGEVKAEVKFDVGGPRWRVYSKKRLDPNWLGEWKVSVIDSSGSTLGANTFSYEKSEGAVAPAAEPAAPEGNNRQMQ